MNQKAEELKARTKRFLLDIICFVNELPLTAAAREIGRQLLRAGMGVAGNYRAACRSRSHREFTARIGVVLEEADESELWLDVLNESRLPAVAVPSALLEEGRALQFDLAVQCFEGSPVLSFRTGEPLAHGVLAYCAMLKAALREDRHVAAGDGLDTPPHDFAFQ